MRLATGSMRWRILVGFGVVHVLLAAEVGVALRGLSRVSALRTEVSTALEC